MNGGRMNTGRDAPGSIAETANTHAPNKKGADAKPTIKRVHRGTGSSRVAPMVKLPMAHEIRKISARYMSAQVRGCIVICIRSFFEPAV